VFSEETFTRINFSTNDLKFLEKKKEISPGTGQNLPGEHSWQSLNSVLPVLSEKVPMGHGN